MTPGHPWPLGAHWDGHGVNFAVFSAHAQRIELCLYDETGTTELRRVDLPGHTQDVRHGYLSGVKPGLVYGLRAHGAWRPERGHRFNPNKLLLDPYAREIVGNFEWRAEHFGADPDHAGHSEKRDNDDVANNFIHDFFFLFGWCIFLFSCAQLQSVAMLHWIGS